MRALRAIRGNRGQGAVELALTMPIFLLILVGILDFGRGVGSYALVGNAAREGARAGIFEHTGDDVIRAAANSQTLFLGAIPDGDITISSADRADRESGATVRVSVVYRFGPLIAAMTGWGTTITMSASSTMLIE